MNNRRRAFGFSLIELLTTLSVLSIVIALGTPSFIEQVRNNRLSSQANELLRTLNLARSEAIKRGQRVTLCKSSSQIACDTSANGVWEAGWILFADNDGDGALDSGEPRLRTGQALSAGTTLRSDSSYTAYVSYLASGVSEGNSGAASGAFRLCDARGASKGHAIAISGTGKATVISEVSTCT